MASVIGVVPTPAAVTPPPAPTPSTSKTVVSSTGDPHIKITESTNGQQTASLKYNDQQGVSDLVDTTALGGINVSTETTAVNAKGVAYNKSVTLYDAALKLKVVVSDSSSSSSSTPAESVSISENLSGNPGEKVSVSENDGKVKVKISDGSQSFSFAVSQNKHGLDVTTKAVNVAVGGAAVSQLITAGQNIDASA